MSGDRDLRDVVDEPGDADRELLQESVLSDALQAAGAAGGVASVGSFLYTRAQYRLARADHDAEQAAVRAQLAAVYEAGSRALDIEWRHLYAQTHGLDALDSLDELRSRDDYVDSFGPEDDYFRGFGVD
jgi:hypothetical protein